MREHPGQPLPSRSHMMAAPSDGLDKAMDVYVGSRMPLLNNVVKAHCGARPLQGINLLLIQHQLLDGLAQVEAFRNLGLDLRDLYWIDIPYTSFELVRAAIQKLGVPSENFTVHDFSPLATYSSYQVTRVRTWLAKHWDTRGQRWVVLDDGAYFLRAAATQKIPLGRVAVVEQTQRGMNNLREGEDTRTLLERLPVINVAESEPKKRIEPRLIARSVVDALEEALDRRLPLKPDDHWLILGYGSIGKAVTTELIDRFHHPPHRIHVFDPDPTRQAEAKDFGHPRWRRDPNMLFAMVIGCSGRPSFLPTDTPYLRDGAFVVSASSGSIELSRDEFIKKPTRTAPAGESGQVKLLNVSAVKSLHTDLVFDVGDRTFTMVNGGFPMNFDGRRPDRIPPEQVQLTAALMVYGAIQAATANNARGIIPLDARFQRTVLDYPL